MSAFGNRIASIFTSRRCATGSPTAAVVKRVIAANLLLIGCGWAAENGRAVISLSAAIVIVAALLVALAAGR